MGEGDEDDEEGPLDDDLLMTRHEKVGLGGSMSPFPLVKRGRRVCGKTVVVQRSCDDFGTRDLNSIGRWADAVS
jgi:hypothetical protein